MAFVKELLPKEELQKNQIENDDGWYVDKEHNAIFYYDYGNFRGPEKVFRLIWNNKIIMVGASQHSVGNNAEEWRQVAFHPEGANSIEEGLKKLTIEEQQFIRQLVISALTSFSTNFFKDQTVTVVFDQRMGFYGRGVV